jgi:hypothetical protein
MPKSILKSKTPSTGEKKKVHFADENGDCVTSLTEIDEKNGMIAW